MAAYVIVLREGPVHDPSAMDAYLQELGKSPVDPKLTSLVLYGAVEAIEGDAPDGVVLLEFPTVDDARAW